MEKYPTSLVEFAEREIRKLIVQGDLELGQRVTEAELAKRFGMSKTPVHEALQHLQREGLVQIRPRQGTFIFTFTEELAESLRGVRILLEGYAIRESVRKNRGRLLKSLGENINRSTKVLSEKEIPPYLKLDKEFHALFFTHADNPYLNAAQGAITVKLQVLWRIMLTNSYTVEDMEMSLGDHRTIAEYILDDDLENACMVLDLHTQRSKKSISFTPASAAVP